MEGWHLDLITDLGPLALASRFRRLGERLSRDASRIYEENGIAFEAPWFPVMYLLKENSPMPVTVIARSLGITHPAVNQLAHAMTRAGLLTTARDSGDDRRRLLSLSAGGRRLLARLEPVWSEIGEATRELVESSGDGVLAAITNMERALDERPMYERVTVRLAKRHAPKVTIVGYQPRLRKYFRELNYEWLNKYFTVEPCDEAILRDPDGQIIKAGGAVLFARVGREIVGTVALVRTDARTFELAKMAVTEKFQGQQIGRRLAEAAIAKARELKARSVILYTSTKLEAALSLYRKLGFVEARGDAGAKQYERCTIKMRLGLK